MMIPAYYNSGDSQDTSWNTLAEQGEGEDSAPVNVVVVNPGCEDGGGYPLCDPPDYFAGGPWLSTLGSHGEFQTDGQLQDHITALRTAASSLTILGYVDLSHGRDPTLVKNDIMGWATYSGVSGIYFDNEGTRSTNPTQAEVDSYTAYARYMSHLVASQSWTGEYQRGTSVFSFGSSSAWMDEFVNCVANYNATNYFVMVETDYATFGTIDPSNADYTWLWNYSPRHFVDLIYGLTDPSQMSGVISKGAALNAMNVYATNLPSGQWSDIASYSYWTNEYNFMANTQEPPAPIFSHFPGGPYDEATRTDCQQGQSGPLCCPVMNSTEL